MHPTQPAPAGHRVSHLDACLSRGMRIDYYDPDGDRYGLPTYPYHCAPGALATIRQLRDQGLRPGGQPAAAQILWRRRKRLITAYLYRIDLAKPKRQATPAQLTAIGKALAARRTCPTCQAEKDYYIPLSTGQCNDCTGRGTR